MSVPSKELSVFRLLSDYVASGRGCGCPGDDFVHEHTRYLLGLHRTLPEEERGPWKARLEADLQALAQKFRQRKRPLGDGVGIEAGESRKDETQPGDGGEPGSGIATGESAQAEVGLPRDFLAAAVVVGFTLDLPVAGDLTAALGQEEGSILRRRGEAFAEAWREARKKVSSGEQVIQRIRLALSGSEPSRGLALCPPRALVEAFRLERSPMVRAAILQLLANRPEEERRSVAPFIQATAGEICSTLPRPPWVARALHRCQSAARDAESFETSARKPRPHPRENALAPPGSAGGFRSRISRRLARGAAWIWKRAKAPFSHGPEIDALYLELLRCLPCLPEADRIEPLLRLTAHRAAPVRRRAILQLCWQAAASNRPEIYSQVLEELIKSPDPVVGKNAKQLLETRCSSFS